MPKYAPNLPPNVAKFYNTELNDAEIQAAMEIEGIDEEIAVLRLQLKTLLNQTRSPENLQLMLKGIELIARSVSARYRMSPRSKEELADSILGVIEGIGAQAFPERFKDV